MTINYKLFQYKKQKMKIVKGKFHKFKKLREKKYETKFNFHLENGEENYTAKFRKFIYAICAPYFFSEPI